MIEPRTPDLLSDAISQEYSWRIMELSNFKNAVITASQNRNNAEGMKRAGLVLLYAHWEGFIKRVADLYYEFVCFQNCTLGELSDCFMSIALRSHLESLQSARKLKIHNEVIHTIFTKQNERANFSSTSPIKTSNLNYEVFEDVCIMIGIDINELHTRYQRGYDRNFQKTIDEQLLTNRNKIAHGKYVPIRLEEYKMLYDVIVNGIFRHFTDLVIEAARAGSYKRNR